MATRVHGHEKAQEAAQETQEDEFWSCVFWCFFAACSKLGFGICESQVSDVPDVMLAVASIRLENESAGREVESTKLKGGCHVALGSQWSNRSRLRGTNR